MTVQVGGGGAFELVGRCPSEDAETLLRYLSANPNVGVDWRKCESLHTAIVQVLIAARLSPKGRPASRFLAELVAPLLRQS